MRIEQMIQSDWPAVAAVYAAGIATGDATFETEVPSWDAWNHGHLPVPRPVVRDGREVVAFAGLSPVSARAVYRGVAEVTIYVAQATRGRGLGRRLLEALVEQSE